MTEIYIDGQDKVSDHNARVVVNTFGIFSIYVNGEPVIFKQEKCKELLAYLVDRRGSSVTRAEAFAILWEDLMYDRVMQKQMDAVIRGLRSTLQNNGIAFIFVLERGTMRIRPELMECDLYRLCEGDYRGIRDFKGRYMTGYTWASMTESYMIWKWGNCLEKEKQSAQIVLGDRSVKRSTHIYVQTFGNFDIIVDGKIISFARSKSKEVMAYLVDRRGMGVSRAKIAAVLWGDTEYGRPRQKQLDVIIRSLRKTLEEYGIGNILQMEKGILCILPELLECDLYRLLAWDERTINEYQGEYMSSYSWASKTESRIDQDLKRLRIQ